MTGMIAGTPEASPAMAASFLTLLRAGHVDGVLLTLEAQQFGGAEWARLAAFMAEDRRQAEPDDPDAESYCDWCGRTTDLGPHDMGRSRGLVTRECADHDACQARRDERFPPDMARVPSFLLDMRQAGEVGDLVRAAADVAARQFLAEAGDVLALTGQSGSSADPGSLPYAVPYAQAYATAARYDPWQHTLRNPRHHGHLVSARHQEGGDIPQGQLQVQPARPPDPPRRRRRRRR